jgi:hypothetical protein
MQLKKSILFSLIFFFITPVLFANVKLGTYTYTIDTVISIMELSLIEEGINPNSDQFNENVESLKNMIIALGEEEFISSVKNQSPFKSIEVNQNSLKLRLQDGEFEIPIEIIKNEIYSKDPESFDYILGYFNENKLYFNFIVTFEKEEQVAISKECKPFYLIPFEREG